MEYGCLGDGSCVCTTGFQGEECEIECVGGWQNPCSGHGLCQVMHYMVIMCQTCVLES